MAADVGGPQLSPPWGSQQRQGICLIAPNPDVGSIGAARQTQPLLQVVNCIHSSGSAQTSGKGQWTRQSCVCAPVPAQQTHPLPLGLSGVSYRGRRLLLGCSKGCLHPSAAHARLVPASSDFSRQHKPLASAEGLYVCLSLVMPGHGWAAVRSMLKLGACFWPALQ